MADIETATTGPDDFIQPVVAMKTINPHLLDVSTAWATVPHLYCDRITLKCNAWDTATLSHDFGLNVRQPNDPLTPLDEIEKLDLVGKFVRVTFGNPPQNWYGYVLEEFTPRNGATDIGKEYGSRQFFECVGLAYFLNRVQIRTAVIHDTDTINRPLIFNGGLSVPVGDKSWERGNMHFEDNADGLRSFYNTRAIEPSFGSITPPERWSATDIVKHCLKYYAPKGSLGEARPCDFELESFSEDNLDDWKPTIRAAGRSPLAVLDSIANPHRGLCWWGRYVDDTNGGAQPNGRFEILVDSLAKNAISLEQGGSLPANITQRTINIDNDERVARLPAIGLPGGRAYKRVVCLGARQTSTFTLSVTTTMIGAVSPELIPNWEPQEESNYSRGADRAEIDDEFSPEEKYDSLNQQQQARRNDLVRREPGFDKVFQSFRVAELTEGWDGKAGDGFTAARSDVFKNISPAGAVTTPQKFLLNGLRTLSYLPVKEGTDEAPSEDDPHFSKPFGFIRITEGPSSSQDKFCLLNETADASSSSGEPESAQEIRASYLVSGERDLFGVRVRSTLLPHTIAKHIPLQRPSLVRGELNYFYAAFTICAEADEFAKGSYPDGVASGVAIEELVIDMGDQYRLDYVNPNTVYKLEAGRLIRSDGGVIRNDQAVLQDFARFAFEWYTSDRRTLNVAFRRIDTSNFSLGYMLTDLGQNDGKVTLNTVIGEIDYVFDRLQGTTRVRTLDDSLSLPDLLG